MTGVTTTDPLQRLADDHRAALDAIEELKRAAESDGCPSCVGKALEFLEGEFTRHMAREDRALLPILETVMGQWCALPAWMWREHEDLRAGIRRVKDAAVAAGKEAGAGLPRLREEVDRLHALLTIHLHREDGWLLPVAKVVLNDQQWRMVEAALAHAG